MIVSSGTNTSSPEVGPFWKDCPAGKCRRPICTPGVSVGISRQRNPDILPLPQQMTGIIKAKREAKQRRDRRQRDVALFPGQSHAEALSAR